MRRMTWQAPLPATRSVALQFLDGQELYRKVIAEGLLRAERSVWIATANLKELWIEPAAGGRRRRYRSILEAFDELCGRGVEVRILHAELPSRRFRAAFDRRPALVSGGLQLKLCPRVHFKAVIVDATHLYLGSANLTGAGLGAKGPARRNFELGLWTEDDGLLDAVAARYDRIWRGDECASCGLLQLCPDPIVRPARLRRRKVRDTP
jgi:phosphatidylserine/phosphatidylglycerophosphate/cardiolipin synthase-like enzyme